jgi:hypothetical protein
MVQKEAKALNHAGFVECMESGPNHGRSMKMRRPCALDFPTIGIWQ